MNFVPFNNSDLEVPPASQLLSFHTNDLISHNNSPWDIVRKLSVYFIETAKHLPRNCISHLWETGDRDMM